MSVHDARILRGAALAVTLLAPIVLGVAGLLAGIRGVLGAAVGLLLTVVFFASSVLAAAVVARRWPGLLLQTGVATYAIKIAALAVALLALQGVTAISLPALAWAVVVGTGTWLAAEVRLFLTAKIPYVEPVVPTGAAADRQPGRR